MQISDLTKLTGCCLAAVVETNLMLVTSMPHSILSDCVGTDRQTDGRLFFIPSVPSFDLHPLKGGTDQIKLLVDWFDHLESSVTPSDPWLRIKASHWSLPPVFVS